MSFLGYKLKKMNIKTVHRRACFIFCILALTFTFFFLMKEINKEEAILVEKNYPFFLEDKAVIEEKITNTNFSPFFIKNEGQAPQEVIYYFQGKDHSIYFTKKGILFQNIYSVDSAEENPSSVASSTNLIREVTYMMRFSNYNEQLKIFGTEPRDTQINFFKGDQQNQNIPTFGKITYRDLYPAIDLEFYFHDGAIKYDIIINPGGDPSTIAFQFDGLKSIRLDDNENLILSTPVQQFVHDAPKTFQNLAEGNIHVGSKYALDQENKMVTFVLSSYDKNFPLIVDPVLSTLSAATFFGAAGTSIRGIDLDSSQNIYVAGDTSNLSFPTTTGAYDITHTGSTDGFITKMSSNLETVLASTFLSGSGDAEVRIRDIALDASDNVFVVGDTGSVNFPTTTGAYDGSKNGGVESSDIFISKFSSNLASVSASTYLGGSDSETAKGFSIDNDGNIYIFGSTGDNFPITAGVYDETPNDLIDFFIAKMSGNLEQLLASTFFDIGNFFDDANGIQLDSNGNVFVFGATSDAAFTTTVGAYDTSYNGGNDGYIAKLSSNLQSLLASTYIGGTGDDYIISITFDSSNNLYAIGDGDSSNFPTTAGVYDTASNGSADIYVSKFSNNLQSLSASTFFGTAGGDSASGISLDSSGNVYIFGDTTSSNFPTTTGVYDSSFNGIQDVIISKFDANLVSLLGSTYVGGSDIDSVISDILFTGDNTFFLAGSSLSSNFPTTIGAYDNTYGGSGFSSDGMIIQLASVNTAPTLTTPTPSQTTSSTVTVTTTISDDDGDITSLTVEHSTNGVTWASSTITDVVEDYGATVFGVGSISGIDTDSASTDPDYTVNLTIIWNIETDLPNTSTSTVY
ncbi:MAG: SBBP repeat-containing protein, partial [Candidatus Magasanikbacteria bacterium]|nr:SBBP repeat-containing protein [Candidatus Magasanikbacteria bacterium]